MAGVRAAPGCALSALCRLAAAASAALGGGVQLVPALPATCTALLGARQQPAAWRQQRGMAQRAVAASDERQEQAADDGGRYLDESGQLSFFDEPLEKDRPPPAALAAAQPLPPLPPELAQLAATAGRGVRLRLDRGNQELHAARDAKAMLQALARVNRAPEAAHELSCVTLAPVRQAAAGDPHDEQAQQPGGSGPGQQQHASAHSLGLLDTLSSEALHDCKRTAWIEQHLQAVRHAWAAAKPPANAEAVDAAALRAGLTATLTAASAYRSLIDGLGLRRRQQQAGRGSAGAAPAQGQQHGPAQQQELEREQQQQQQQEREREQEQEQQEWDRGPQQQELQQHIDAWQRNRRSVLAGLKKAQLVVLAQQHNLGEWVQLQKAGGGGGGSSASALDSLKKPLLTELIVEQEAHVLLHGPDAQGEQLRARLRAVMARRGAGASRAPATSSTGARQGEAGPSGSSSSSSSSTSRRRRAAC